MELKNLDAPDEEHYVQRHFLAPQHPFRALLIGPSGCGKTNVALNLILQYLHYDRIWVYSRHLEQPKMRLLRDFFDRAVELLCEKSKGELTPEDLPLAHFADSAEEIVPVDELDASLQHLIVFDDLVLEKDQRAIIEYFVRGRHANASVMYLSQDYHRIPKTIRLNSNYVCLWAVTSGNELGLIRRDQATDVSQEEFQRMFRSATATPYSFLTVDRKTKLLPLKYREQFDRLWRP